VCAVLHFIRLGKKKAWIFSDRLPGGTNWQTLRGILLAAPSATVTNIAPLGLATERFYGAVYAS